MQCARTVMQEKMKMKMRKIIIIVDEAWNVEGQDAF